MGTVYHKSRAYARKRDNFSILCKSSNPLSLFVGAHAAPTPPRWLGPHPKSPSAKALSEGCFADFRKLRKLRKLLQRTRTADEDMRPSAPALGNGTSCPSMTTLRFALPGECFSRISLRSLFLFLKKTGVKRSALSRGYGGDESPHKRKGSARSASKHPRGRRPSRRGALVRLA